MAEAEIGVYNRSIHGGKWVLISNITQKVMSLGTFFFLAHLLNPADFGIISIIFLITGAALNFFSLDFEKVLIQQRDADQEGAILDVVWTFNFFKSVVLAGLMWVFAPWLASFFHLENEVSLMRWGAVFIFIPVLTNSRQFYFTKNIEFKKFFWRDNLGQVAYIIVTFSWIFWVEQTVWALFMGQIARYVVSVIMTYILYPHWQRMSFRFGLLRKLVGYAKWVTGQNIVDYILGIVDSLYIGRLLNPASVGLYTKARDISFVPVAPFFTIFDKLSFAAYSRIQDQLSKLQEGFLRTFDVMVAITVPIFVVMLAFGGFIVQFLLGPKWLGAVVPLKILSASIIFSSLVILTKPIFDAFGRPDINFKLSMLQLAFLVVGLYAGAHYGGLPGVSVAVFFSWLLMLIMVIWYARPMLRLGWDKFRGTLIPVGLAIGGLLALATPLYLYNKVSPLNGVLLMGLLVGLGVVYAALVWFIGIWFERGPRQTLLSIVSELRH